MIRNKENKANALFNVLSGEGFLAQHPRTPPPLDCKASLLKVESYRGVSPEFDLRTSSNSVFPVHLVNLSQGIDSH